MVKSLIALALVATVDSSNQAAWWSPLETYVGGSSYAYMAYNEPGSTPGTHKVAIARRDGAGNFSKLPVMNGSAQAEYPDDVGHNQPSMARDGAVIQPLGSAAVDITWHPTEGRRVYFCTASGAQMVTASGVTAISPGIPVSRLSVERDASGVDVLYLVDLTNLRLYYGRNP